MKAALRVVVVLVWAVLCFAALGWLITGKIGGTTVGDRIQFGVNLSTSATLIHEERISMQDVERLELSAGSYSVRVYLTDGHEMIVRQYGSDDVDEDQYVRVERTGETVKAHLPHQVSVHIGIFLVSEYLEVEIPRDWVGDGKLESGSGSVRIYDSLNWRGIVLSSTSGSVHAEGVLVAENAVEMSSRSGSVRAETVKGRSVAMSAVSGSVTTNGSVTATGDVTLSSNSGSVRMLSSVTAQNLTATSISGSVRAEGALTISDKVELRAESGSVRTNHTVSCKQFAATSTSGSVGVESLDCERFALKSSSGSVKGENVTGSGTVLSTSGSVNLQRLVPTGDVELSSTSGSVTVRIPSTIAFLFEGQSGSGSVRGDYDLLYSGQSKKHGVVTNGDNAEHLVKATSSSGSVRILM